MKKLPGLLLLILIAFQPGCKKSNGAQEATAAHVRYGGEPAVDGAGFYIQIDATHENVYAMNLPSMYKIADTTSTQVAIKFVDTGKRQIAGFGLASGGGWRVVYLVSIVGDRP
jgi:hypothetical protein